MFGKKEHCVVCKECGKTWYYNKDDMKKFKDSKTLNEAKKSLGTGAFLLGGFLLGAGLTLIPDKQEIDPTRCPACGSRNVHKK